MDISEAFAGLQAVQRAFHVISALHLTAYLMPPQANVTNGQSFDYIIVGGGTAGCVLANRLTEDKNTHVLVVEAGGDPPLETQVPQLEPYLLQSYVDWNITSTKYRYSQQCHKDGVQRLVQGKMLGGSSGLGYMVYLRGVPKDYAAWSAAAGDNSWNWDALYPYFIKSERMLDSQILESKYKSNHGTHGYLGVTKSTFNVTHKYLEAFEELGHKIVLDITNHSTGYTQPLVTIDTQAPPYRQSTAFAYLTPAKDRPNLHVLKNTLVTKILFDNDKNARGVEALTETGNTLIIKATKEVVVAAGALQSPKLLMLSGIGPKNHLRSMKIKLVADLPVGENLQDHVSIPVAHQMERTSAEPPPIPTSSYIYPAVFGYVAMNESNSVPDYNTLSIILPPGRTRRSAEKGLPFIEPTLQICSSVLSITDELCAYLHQNSFGRNLFFTLINMLHPNSRGRVLLSSKDPEKQALVQVRYFNNKTDVENAVDYLMDYSRIGSTTYFKSVHAQPIYANNTQCRFEGEKREFFRCYLLCANNSLYEYVGTCAVGSVVDAQMRVRGVKRLRVVDASVIPSLPSGGLIAPLIALAEKAADIIKQDNS